MQMTLEPLEGGGTMARLQGRLDVAGAQEIDLRMAAVAGSTPRLVVDLSRVEFLASMGIRTLLMAAKALNVKGGAMAIAGPTAAVRQVLVSTGVDRIVPLEADVPAAAARLGA